MSQVGFSTKNCLLKNFFNLPSFCLYQYSEWTFFFIIFSDNGKDLRFWCFSRTNSHNFIKYLRVHKPTEKCFTKFNKRYTCESTVLRNFYGRKICFILWYSAGKSACSCFFSWVNIYEPSESFSSPVCNLRATRFP